LVVRLAVVFFAAVFLVVGLVADFFAAVFFAGPVLEALVLAVVLLDAVPVAADDVVRWDGSACAVLAACSAWLSPDFGAAVAGLASASSAGLGIHGAADGS